MSLKEEIRRAKDAAAASTTDSTIDLEGEQVQTYTNQKINNAVEEALKKSAIQQKEVVDDLSKQLDALKSTIEGKDKEIENLKESTSGSTKATEDDSQKVDVKKLMSTIYDRFKQKFPDDSEEEVKNPQILKAVRLILKQVAAESEASE